MSTADHELHAALQADVADERQADVDRLEAEVLRLKRGLMHEVLDRAGFRRTASGRYEKATVLTMLGDLSSYLPLSPEQAQQRLATYGIPVTFVPLEEQSA